MSVQLATSSARPDSCNRQTPRSLAIVGGGPRGLYCLESLVRLANRQESRPPLAITIFEPSPTVGAGNVYEPTQPPFLRMNFAAKHINAWPPGDAEPNRPNLMQWLAERRGRQTDPNAILPRAVVGEYLHDCFLRVASSLPAEISLRVQRLRVTGLCRVANRWELTTKQGTAGGFDEVLLTVGHQGWRDASERIYPVGSQLSQDRIPAGATVAIRGFALTWIDATLALTEGRGGTFHSTPHGFRYERCGFEPARIVPRSRSFRPMLAKPEDGKTPYAKRCRTIWKTHRRWIDSLVKPKTGFDFIHHLWPLVLQAASHALQHLHADSQDAEGWMHDWVSGPMSGAAAEMRMRSSFAVASGRAQPDSGWALGEAWRQLYPALVNRISHGGLAAASWPGFRDVAREMERIAFGPPAENLARMLALIDAGIVDLSASYSNASDTCRLDAVTPAPHDSPADSPLQALLQAGVIQQMAGGQAIAVDRCGRPQGRNGRAVPGLAILGRPTEEWIVGNDTLSRTLHQHSERWAQAVAHQLLRVPSNHVESA